MDIEKTYNKLSKSMQKARKAMSDFRESIKDICDHPEKHQHYYNEDRDDGYGRWWKIRHKTCIICMQDFYTYNGKDWRKSEK